MIIESHANPVVRTLRSLEQGKVVRARRQFLAEGVRLVEDGLDAGLWPAICLYSPELLSRTERGKRLLRRLTSGEARGKHATIYEASTRALEAASATLHPQGVVAAFPMMAWPEPGAEPGVNPLALICDNIQDPGNLGTILRTAEAAGVEAVWLSPGCVDLYNPKVVRAAMGAHFRLPAYTANSWAAIAEQLVASGISVARTVATDAGGERPYDAVDWTQPGALIVSNEAHGLSEEARALAQSGGGTIAIPMLGGTESLNAATAAAIILFEAARQRRTQERSHRGGS